MTDTTEASSPKKGKEKELTVVQDQGVFKFPTGDTYEGYFEAKKKDRSVKMQGPGVYTTAEGDIYSGNWENDKFGGIDVANISYTDGSKYEGYIRDWSYFGPGKYTYPDNSTLSCDFVDNFPVGNLTVMDPNGHIWLAKADLGQAWFEPVNHYYDVLEQVRESTKIKKRRKRPTIITSTPTPPEPEKKRVQLKT